MTTRERIFVMASGGDELHLIAARLGLTVTDVAETLADPAHTPSDPSGGGGGIPTNWAIASLKIPELVKEHHWSNGPLTPGWTFAIGSQAGEDFSVGEYEEEPALLSAGGGLFYVRMQAQAVIDYAEDEEGNPIAGDRVLTTEMLCGDPLGAPAQGIAQVATFVKVPGLKTPGEGGTNDQFGSFIGGDLAYVPPGGLVGYSVAAHFIGAKEGEGRDDVVKPQDITLHVVQLGLPA